MAEPIVIPRRFNGPPGSANGGYTCGLVAARVDAPAAEVTLRAPPPLERPLEVRRDGDAVSVLDGEMLVAEGRPGVLSVEPPVRVEVEAAQAASRAGYERWSGPHPFPTCVVCGPRRPPGDGFGIYPGPLPGGDGAFAAVWTPEGVAPELAWAALDCPTSAPVANFGQGPAMVLARLTARIDEPVRPGRPHAIVSWPLGSEGRKHHAAAALLSEEGELVAAAQALWIQLRA